MIRFFFCFLLLVGLPAVAAPKKQLDILETIADNRILTKFHALIIASGQSDLLRSRGPFTIFAPTDSAFARFTLDQWDDYLSSENQPELERVLLFHIVNGKKMSAMDLVRTSIFSAEGAPLHLEKSKSGTVRVEKAKIIRTDIHCKNGVIHEIDLLLPPPGDPLPRLPPPPAIKALPLDAPTGPPAETPTGTTDTNAPPAVTPDTNAASAPATSTTGASTNLAP